MAYEPTEWKKGDVITAEKMNKIENGITNASEIRIIRFSQDEYEAKSKIIEPNLELDDFTLCLMVLQTNQTNESRQNLLLFIDSVQDDKPQSCYYMKHTPSYTAFYYFPDTGILEIGEI